MVSDRRRARRRLRRARRRLSGRVVAAAVATAVVVALAVGIAGQERRQSLPYDRTVDLGFASLVGPLGLQSATTGRQLAGTLSGASGSDRVTLLAALQAEAGAAARTAASAAAAAHPAPAAAAASDCVRALQQRSAAAALVRSAVTALLGGATGSAGSGPASSQMQAAGTAVQASDAGWARCRSSLRQAPGRARIPASSWEDGGSGVTAVALTSAVGSLASAPGLAAAPGLSIQAVTTEPAAVGVAGSRYTLPATDRLTVRVLVADTGNVSLPAVTVTVAVAPAGGGPGAVARRTVSLAAGSAQAVDLAGLAIVPGSSDTVTVTADAGGAAPAAPPASVSVSVAQAASAVAVTPSANPVAAGAAVTYTAVVTGSLSGAGALTGPVAFEDGGNPIPGCASRTLSGGTATCTVRYPTGGYHTVTAVYGGTATIGGSTSPAITETVHAAPAGSSGGGRAGSSGSGRAGSPGPAHAAKPSGG